MLRSPGTGRRLGQFSVSAGCGLWSQVVGIWKASGLQLWAALNGLWVTLGYSGLFFALFGFPGTVHRSVKPGDWCSLYS